MACEQCYLGICFVTPPIGLESSIFGFAEFISELALLVIVYTVTNIRYQFRVAVAPIPLFRLTFWFIGIIGFGTLLTDIWFSERWLMPDFLINQAIWQGMFGAIFLFLAMMWIYYAFINPPVFGEKNYREFAQKLYSVILKGSDSELPVIADELARSAKPLVKLSKQKPPRWQNESNKKEKEKKRKPDAGDYAYDVLLLIGNRKLCRHIIASSPRTAIEFFEAIATNDKYDLPIGQFTRNISTDAIINKDSILYHEDEGYSSGLIGYLKPFSKAVYGNYRLVESLGINFGSPLDIHHEIVWSWDASQLEAYYRAVIITLKSYLETSNWNRHSYALYNALDNIKNSCHDVYKLNDIPDYYSTDIFKRLDTAVDFIEKAINLIDKQQSLPSTKLRVRRDDHPMHGDFYDHIADIMFEIIFSAASVTAPSDRCWAIHHNTVWYKFFIGPFCEGKAWAIIQFKLRRLLYDEILQLEELPNYKSSSILGFCLNVMGLKIGKKTGHGRNCYSLRKAVLAWTRKNFLHLKSIQPEVAKSCLIGSISFDEQGARLVKTYFKGLNLEAPKEYLEL